MYIVFILLFLFALILLPIALIKPTLLTKGLITTRKKALAIFGGATLLFFILAVATTPPQTKVESQTLGTQVSPTSIATPVPSSSPVISPSPSVTPIPTPTAKPTVKPTNLPTQTPKQQTTTTQPTTGSTGNTYSGGDKDCKDFKTQSEAQAYFNSKGGSASNNVDRLDGSDHDGKVCEALP